MSDIFREVEEEVRRERLEKLWKKYGDHFIALGALLVIGAAGVQLYRVYEQREANRASVGYMAAADLLESGQAAAAAAQFAVLAKGAPGGYAEVSELAQADAMFNSGERGAAVNLYDKIVQKGDPYLSAVARLHAAWAIVDGAPRSDVDALLAPLADPGNPWHLLAREVLAYDDLRAGNAAKALAGYEEIAGDPNTPSGLRTRSKVMVKFLKAGGDLNFGHVPEPKPPQTLAGPSTPAPAAPRR